MITKELRQLAAYGRKLKNEKLRKGELELDLQPQADLFRDGEHLATVFLTGDGQQSAMALVQAVIGYTADKVIATWDAYGTWRAEDSINLKPGELEKWFYSSDPELTSKVVEALWCLKWTFEDNEVATETVVVPYRYSKRRHRFRWSEPIEQEGFGPIIEAVSESFKQSVNVSENLDSIIDFKSADLPKARLHRDISTTKLLLVQGVMVLLRVEQKDRAEMQESMKDLPGVRIENFQS